MPEKLNGIFDSSYPITNIIGFMKLKRISWMGMWHAWGEMRNSHRVLLENLKGRDYLDDLGIDGRIILSLRNVGGGCGLDSLGSECRPMADRLL